MRPLVDAHRRGRCLPDGFDLSACHQQTLYAWPGRGSVRLGRLIPDNLIDGHAVIGAFDSVVPLLTRDQSGSTVAVLEAPTVTSLQRLEAELTWGEHSGRTVKSAVACM